MDFSRTMTGRMWDNGKIVSVERKCIGYFARVGSELGSIPGINARTMTGNMLMQDHSLKSVTRKCIDFFVDGEDERLRRLAILEETNARR